MIHKIMHGVREVVDMAATEVRLQGKRRLARLTSTGDYRRPLQLDRDRVVLLFFEDVERDTLVRHDRYLRRALRRGYHAFSSGQKVSGFGVWFSLLVKALSNAGYRVVVNDYELARRNPRYPVGILGYSHILHDWPLCNPAILGPGLLDHPLIRPDLMKDPRFKFYIVSCSWMKDIFERVYGPCCVPWFAGIDINDWPDCSNHPKDIDVLIYDKIRWNYSLVKQQVLDPLVLEIEKRGLTYQILRYGRYEHRQYHSLLSRSRSMAFICEHEAQGMAYQEAMACNVPILAWDSGIWHDPQRAKYETAVVAATSVPYFSSECGERFADGAAIPDAFAKFWSGLKNYAPRTYVQQQLSFSQSADMYLKHYRHLFAD